MNNCSSSKRCNVDCWHLYKETRPRTAEESQNCYITIAKPTYNCEALLVFIWVNRAEISSARFKKNILLLIKLRRQKLIYLLWFCGLKSVKLWSVLVLLKCNYCFLFKSALLKLNLLFIKNVSFRQNLDTSLSLVASFPYEPNVCISAI